MCLISVYTTYAYGYILININEVLILWYYEVYMFTWIKILDEVIL